ncbi:hypothetical protein XENTR_v10022604 [Xenopus tropicalis]|nr:hypothetical protein XENTR_v10022604 [Xenopus tropicalis]
MIKCFTSKDSLVAFLFLSDSSGICSLVIIFWALVIQQASGVSLSCDRPSILSAESPRVRGADRTIGQVSAGC